MKRRYLLLSMIVTIFSGFSLNGQKALITNKNIQPYQVMLVSTEIMEIMSTILDDEMSRISSLELNSINKRISDLATKNINLDFQEKLIMQSSNKRSFFDVSNPVRSESRFIFPMLKSERPSGFDAFKTEQRWNTENSIPPVKKIAPLIKTKSSVRSIMLKRKSLDKIDLLPIDAKLNSNQSINMQKGSIGNWDFNVGPVESKK